MENNTTKNICIIAVFLALMLVLSPISIPMVPVPITLATLMVYLISAMLPLKVAPLVIVLYVLLGLAGLPVFSNFSGGPAVLMGPTGGFIFGYILASVLESFLITRFKEKKWMYPVSMVLATIVIYAFGSAWFMVQMQGKYSFGATMMVCVVPFLIGDTIKIVLASIVSLRLRRFTDLRFNKAK
jgi:biotin transport system substrate-specific component